MSYEFTAEEMAEVVRTASIFCPGFSEQQYQDLMAAQRRVRDSSELRAVHGLARLEEQMGVSAAEALEAYRELVSESERLASQNKDLRQGLAQLQRLNRQAEEASLRLKASFDQAEKELQALQAECRKQESQLAAHGKQAEREKRRLDAEMEECRLKAAVTEEEVLAAGKIKDQLQKGGFSIDLALELSSEFARHKDARETLAEAIAEYGTLTSHNQQAQAKKEALQADVAGLESDRRRLESTVSQLQADLTFEQDLRGFYHRYQGVSALMDHLAGWNQVFFMRCGNPLAAMAGAISGATGGAHFWTDQPPAMCPRCGYRQLYLDERLYQALGCPVGAPLRLTLGE